MFPVWLACLVISFRFVNGWDVAVTVDGQIEFFNGDGSRAGIASEQFNDLIALSYDAVYQTLYFSDTANNNTTVYNFKLSDTKNFQPLVRRNVSDSVQGVAFDPVSGILFWTDTRRETISWMSLVPGSNIDENSQVLVQMKDGEKPQAIAVDSCRGNIYWTNANLSNPTIEMMTIDGKDRRVVVKDDLFMPVGVTVDQESKKIYWADDKEGIHFRIESANFDGTNRTIIYEGTHHQPYSLAVNNGTIYWTDWIYRSIWKLPINSAKHAKPTQLKDFKSVSPMGIVARINLLEQTKGVPECKALEQLIFNTTNRRLQSWAAQDKGIVSNVPMPVNIVAYCLNGGSIRWNTEVLTGNKVCHCLRGYIGDRCEISLCHNYCMNGTCLLDDHGYPKCRCFKGFYGDRCSYSVCDRYCLNDGSCEAIDDTKATCSCSPGWKGDRCQIEDAPKPNTNCSFRCPENNMNTIIVEEKLTDNIVEVQNLQSDMEQEQKNISNLLSQPSYESSDTDILNDPKCLDFIVYLSVLCAVLFIINVVLTRMIVVLKKRPRIKKRIIVNKNVTPLTCRPNPPQCEITIENCCNMNICETPCFEAGDLRAQIADMTRKEEKKNLLMNIEKQDDTY